MERCAEVVKQVEQKLQAHMEKVSNSRLSDVFGALKNLRKELETGKLKKKLLDTVGSLAIQLGDYACLVEVELFRLEKEILKLKDGSTKKNNKIARLTDKVSALEKTEARRAALTEFSEWIKSLFEEFKVNSKRLRFEKKNYAPQHWKQLHHKNILGKIKQYQISKKMFYCLLRFKETRNSGVHFGEGISIQNFQSCFDQVFPKVGTNTALSSFEQEAIRACMSALVSKFEEKLVKRRAEQRDANPSNNQDEETEEPEAGKIARGKGKPKGTQGIGRVAGKGRGRSMGKTEGGTEIPRNAPGKRKHDNEEGGRAAQKQTRKHDNEEGGRAAQKQTR